MSDNVDHPSHYIGRDGVNFECIDLTEWQTFCTGNAIKYLWRFRSKGKPLEDLQKAKWYVHRALMNGETVLHAFGGDDILHTLVESTTGFERVAWQGFDQSDWHMVIEALDRMIERLENGEEI